MKKSLTVLFVCFSVVVFGQNYKLFNGSSKKIFASGTIADTTYGIAFDPLQAIGSDSVYYNYTGLDEWIVSENCEYWGPPDCHQQNKPSWIGLNVIFDNISKYKFNTNQNDTLIFDFSIAQGDSMLFFQDETQKFYMVFEGSDTTTILGIADSARFYRIINTDLAGNTIFSALNNEMIVTGKLMGLADFFRIDYFPQLLQPVHLVGNTAPDAGIYRLTAEMLYDYQPGDEIQYIDRYSNPGGPPWLNYFRYIKHNFISRTNTADSIFYTVKRFTFELGAVSHITDTIILKYRKNEIVTEIPFDKINQSDILRTKRLYQEDYCGLTLWSYKVVPEYLGYCSAENCWGYYDIPGPPPIEETIYVCGLGIYNDEGFLYTYPPMAYSFRVGVIYFNKNGIECGNEMIVNINDPLAQAAVFTIYPNPANDYLFVKTDKVEPGTLWITDINGQLIKSTTLSGPLSTIEIGSLSPGIYLAKIVMEGYVGVKKFIKN